MDRKHSLEVLNQTLKDLNHSERPSGSSLILLSGDFRQTLPVISRSTYAVESNEYLKSSIL